MVWIYEDPFTKEEQLAYEELNEKLKHTDIAKLTIKLLSLAKFIKQSNFKKPKDLEKSAYFDKQKRYPIFTKESSISIITQKGGASEAYPFTDYLVIRGLNTVGSVIPDMVENPVVNLYTMVTGLFNNVKENAPLMALVTSTLHGVAETGVTATADVASDVAGPVGAAAVAPVTLLVALATSGLALLENDFGQAVAHFSYAMPFIGSAIGTALVKMEKFVEDLEEHPGVASFIPLVSTYIAQKQGGKRFLTLKHHYSNNKWKKTRRNKFGTR